ncbi:MAG: hypothetical protein H7Z72_05185 [Bacteroidetes bacterium]|nr:hypothetical protein [Fibrella sp.]
MKKERVLLKPASAADAGTVVSRMAPMGVSGFSDQFYLVNSEGRYRTGIIIPALGWQ